MVLFYVPTIKYRNNPITRASTRAADAAYWPKKGLKVNVRFGDMSVEGMLYFATSMRCP